MYDHLILKPFPKGYTVWLRHGETSSINTVVETPSMPQGVQGSNEGIDPMFNMVNDAFGHHSNNEGVGREEVEGMSSPIDQRMPTNCAEFLELVRVQ